MRTIIVILFVLIGFVLQAQNPKTFPYNCRFLGYTQFDSLKSKVANSPKLAMVVVDTTTGKIYAISIDSISPVINDTGYLKTTGDTSWGELRLNNTGVIKQAGSTNNGNGWAFNGGNIKYNGVGFSFGGSTIDTNAYGISFGGSTIKKDGDGIAISGSTIEGGGLGIAIGGSYIKSGGIAINGSRDSSNFSFLMNSSTSSSKNGGSNFLMNGSNVYGYGTGSNFGFKSSKISSSNGCFSFGSNKIDTSNNIYLMSDDDSIISSSYINITNSPASYVKNSINSGITGGYNDTLNGTTGTQMINCRQKKATGSYQTWIGEMPMMPDLTMTTGKDTILVLNGNAVKKQLHTSTADATKQDTGTTWKKDGNIIPTSVDSVTTPKYIGTSSKYPAIFGTNGKESYRIAGGNQDVIFMKRVFIPTLYGGIGSGANLTLQSTSNATKGKIFLGTASAYDQVNNSLLIGRITSSSSASFDYAVEVEKSFGGTLTYSITNTSTANGSYVQTRYVNDATSALNIGIVGSNTSTSGAFVKGDAYNMTSCLGYSIGTLNTNGIIRIYAGNTERVRIDKDGKIGQYAVTSPTYDYSMNGDVARTQGLERTTTGTNGFDFTKSAGGCKASTANLNGGSSKTYPGVSTGTGFAAVILGRYSRYAASTSDNTISDALVITSEKRLQRDTATQLFTVSNATLTMASGHIKYGIEHISAGNDTIRQESGMVTYSASRIGASFVSNINLSNNINTQNPSGASALTTTWSILDGTTSFTIRCQPSGVPTGTQKIRIWYIINNESKQTITQL